MPQHYEKLYFGGHSSGMNKEVNQINSLTSNTPDRYRVKAHRNLIQSTMAVH